MGVGAVVLGILALTGHNPVVLSLVSMIALGAAILLGDSPITDRLFGMAG
jgi:divalent metal cation (Fe/Co/Zn/Cd) transporter